MPPVSQLLGLAGTRDAEMNVQPHIGEVLVADNRKGDMNWCHLCGPLSSQAARQGGVRAVGSVTPTGCFSDYLGFCFPISRKVWLPRYLLSVVRGTLCLDLCVCAYPTHPHTACTCTSPQKPSTCFTLSLFGWNPESFP